ncbi:mechanosensitive ion channel family protein [bacterium]|nr:mechanosensitive ion channel family protein [bacterium]
MQDQEVLLTSIQALGVLLLGLTVHHLLLRKLQLPWTSWQRFQARLRVPSLLPIFLGALLQLCRGIGDLQVFSRGLELFLYYGILVTLLEAMLSPFVDGPEGSRLPDGLQAWLRVILYGGTSLVPLALVCGVPLFDPHFQNRLCSVGVLYLSLHLSYTYLVKWLPWQHPLTLALRQRLRFLLYVLLVAVVGYFALLHFEIYQPGDPQLAYGRAVIMVIIGTLGFEGALVSLFDYYFPLIRRWDVPTLFRDLARGLGYLAILGVVMVTVFQKDPSSLLLGSAVVSVALGFALQETLGNFFAGLALRLARPYTLGDRIEVAALSGNVHKIDWRSTAMMNNQGDLLILPNAKLAQETIINHSSPTSVTGRFIEVGVHYRHAPNLVKKLILEACASVGEALREPEPEMYLLNFADSAITYRLRYFIHDFAERFRIDSKVREAIWYHFNREGIEIPFPIRTIYHAAPEAGVDVEREVRSLLDSVDFFQVLGEEGLAVLRRRARYELYAAGEKVCVQGQPGESLYIIRRGRLQATVVNEQGDEIRAVEMRAGQYFGEMALLTGEPRSATVTAMTDSELLRLRKEDLRAILTENSKVEEMLSEVLAQRKIKDDQARQEAEEERSSRGPISAAGEGLHILSKQILAKIRDFFSY